jgi:hypothetical protein
MVIAFSVGAARLSSRLKPRTPAADDRFVLTRALVSGLLLAIPLLASWLLVRRAGHPATERF